MHTKQITMLTCLLTLVLGFNSISHAAETDQYLSWNTILKDSAPPINDYINQEIETYLNGINNSDEQTLSEEEIVSGIYIRLFQGIYASKIRNWLHKSQEIDRFPSKTISYFDYQKQSIYRDPIAPYILPLSHTIRVGEVYCGTDKFSHFFGYGRRYYNWTKRYQAWGMTEEEATERAIRRGINTENGFVGKLVDGIFSHADLEADYQGYRLAKDLCDGDNPFITNSNGIWTLHRPIDIRAYVTPDFDESYNPSHYNKPRLKNVLPILQSEYRAQITSEIVQQRFSRYRQEDPSFSQHIIAKYFQEQGSNPQIKQYHQAFGIPPYNNQHHKKLAANTSSLGEIRE
jgi:hypothetical protein